MDNVEAASGDVRKLTLSAANELDPARKEALIAQLDQRPKQVMIEAKLIEVNLLKTYSLGVGQMLRGAIAQEAQQVAGIIKNLPTTLSALAGAAGSVGNESVHAGGPGWMKAECAAHCGPAELPTSCLPMPHAKTLAIAASLIFNPRTLLREIFREGRGCRPPSPR